MVRNWLRASGLDKFIMFLPLTTLAIFIGEIFAYLVKSDALAFIAFIWPFSFWAIDAVMDQRVTGGDIKNMVARDDVVLATRAEYIGGHPRLPHGRFVYLTLSGTKENPILTMVFPGNDEIPEERYEIPLLDLDKTDHKSETAESLTGSIFASISEKPGKMFAGERVTLSVKYQGPGGRKHIVELSSFFHGNDEVRNWRNYLVCAQAEADTGITPRSPWKSLRSEAAFAGTAPLRGFSSKGHASGIDNRTRPSELPSRSAFKRR
jgi:hypothetical protein